MTLASRARSWLPLLPLLGILAVTYWLDQKSQPEGESVDNSKLHTPDAIVDNLHAVTLNQQGKPSFIMSAKQLVHYADDDSTTLAEPDISALSPPRPNIYMSAAKGTLSSKGDVIELMENVKIVRAPSKTSDELTVTTDYIKLIPELETAQTHKTVTVIENNNRISAVGMEMDNKARIIKLLSRVRASNATNQN